MQRAAPLSRAWLLRPRTSPALGRVKEGIEAIQAETLTELRAVDAEVERLVTRRTELIRELRRCRDAFGGVGWKWSRRVPLPGDVDSVPAGTKAIGGRDLRETLLDILRSAERPLSLAELHRTLLAHGRHVHGRPSHTLANALRTAVTNGEAERVRPGVYAAGPPPAASGSRLSLSQ